MKRFRIISLTVLALAAFDLAALGSVVTAGAGAAEFQRLRWKGRTIRIDISSSLTRPNTNIKYGSDVAGAIQRSLQAWQSAANIQIVTEPSDKQNVSPSGVTGDGASLITIAQTPENVLFFAKDAEASSAKTRIFFDRKGYITEADIVLNPFQQFSTDGTFGTFDLESTLTHEIGHLLGLRHSGVLGSTMADNFGRVGTFGTVDLGPRTLAESDMASIRDLYGPARDATECCGSISGKLVYGSGRSMRALKVWAEEDRTGRVVAETEANTDGTFILGGLPPGSYALFWKTVDDVSASIGQLPIVKVQTGEIKTISEKIDIHSVNLSAEYIGLNNQIAEFGVPVSPGRSFVLYLGGRNIDARAASVEFNSPYFTILPNSASSEDFGASVSVISIVVNVHPNTPPGEYSVFLAGDRGLEACLIGGLSVE